jgi:HEAT repeat protein
MDPHPDGDPAGEPDSPTLSGLFRLGGAGEPRLSAYLPAPWEVRAQDARFQSLAAADLGPIFEECLGGGFRDILVRALGQVRIHLASRNPDDRQWALEGAWALVTQDRLDRIPHEVLSDLMADLVRALAKEDQEPLAALAAEALGLPLGIEAAEDRLDTVLAFFKDLERMGRTRGTAVADRILASRGIVMAPLERFLEEGSAALEANTLPFFRFAGTAGAATLVALLEAEESRWRRLQMLELLKRMGPICLPALLGALKDGPWYLVRNALVVLGDLQAREGFEAVVPCLEHPEPRVVTAAVQALGRMGGAARAERLLLDALREATADRRPLYLEGLGQLRAVGALPAVGTLASAADEPEAVRIKALETLGRICHPSAVPVLAAILAQRKGTFGRSEPQPVRVAAARALAALGLAEAQAVLDRAVAAEPRDRRKAFVRAVQAPPPPGSSGPD